MILFLILIFISSIPARMNDTFLGIHINALGGNTSLVGIAFFISAGTEIIVFALSYIWLRKGKELLIITIAIFFYSLRFFLSGLVESPVKLAMIQLLQMVTFPIFYTAAIQYLYQIVPRVMESNWTNCISIIVLRHLWHYFFICWRIYL